MILPPHPFNPCLHSPFLHLPSSSSRLITTCLRIILHNGLAFYFHDCTDWFGKWQIDGAALSGLVDTWKKDPIGVCC